jgi:homeobox protein HB9
MAATTTLETNSPANSANNNNTNSGATLKKSFCIEALLARSEEPEDGPVSPSISPRTPSPQSPGTSVHSVSPPISPGSEDVALPVDTYSGVLGSSPHLIPRPGLLANSTTPSSAVAAALFAANHHQNHLNHHAVYGYPNHHHHHLLTGGSAFHPLEAATGGVKGGGGAPGGGAGPAGSQQHLQHMQLEWLARTGMFYPRLPDLAGQ